MRHYLCALLLLVGVLGLTAAEVAAPPTLALGAAAPDFKLLGTDGKTYRLKNFSGAKVLVVVFTCNHCPTAQAYEERLKEIVTDYKKKDVALVAISCNDPRSIRLNELGYTDLSDSLEEMVIRAKDKAFNFPYLYDGDKQEAGKAYGPTATPHAFVFDHQRKLRYVGRIDDNERVELVKHRDLRDALDNLLANQPVATPQTKCFGCSTKWAGKQEAVKTYLKQLATEPVTIENIDVAGLEKLRKNESGKYRLINVWATWCGPCVTEIPEFVALHRMYGHREFEMVSVSANYPDEQKKVLGILKKQQASYKNYIFGESDKYKLMAALDPNWNGGLPFAMLISPAGAVVYQRQGEMDFMELRRAILTEMGRIK